MSTVCAAGDCHHLASDEGGNARNGYGRKTVAIESGWIELEIPRDRQASFDPQLIAKYRRRFPGFDEKIISMYAHGMSAREIVGHLRDLYGIDVSPDLVSSVTDPILDEIAAWQARQPEPVCPIVFFDALRVRSRTRGWSATRPSTSRWASGPTARRRSSASARAERRRQVPVMNELRNRDVEDILLVVDGLKGFPVAILAVFPEATVQTCIVHLLRHSLDFVSYKDRKPLAAALKGIYRRSTPKPARPCSRPSRKASGVGAIRPLARAGGAPGTMSSPSAPSIRTCVGSSILRTRSRP